jgi:hypothetical protein
MRPAKARVNVNVKQASKYLKQSEVEGMFDDRREQERD